MFTLKQIQAAHAKVKSGADFPKYVHTLREMGVTRYDVYVSDGHTDYYDQKGFRFSSEPVHAPLKVAEEDNRAKFNDYLKFHQDGRSNYETFCKHAAETGVEKWFVDIAAMTCTYCNKKCEEILVEAVPAILN